MTVSELFTGVQKGTFLDFVHRLAVDLDEPDPSDNVVPTGHLLLGRFLEPSEFPLPLTPERVFLPDQVLC